MIKCEHNLETIETLTAKDTYTSVIRCLKCGAVLKIEFKNPQKLLDGYVKLEDAKRIVNNAVIGIKGEKYDWDFFEDGVWYADINVILKELDKLGGKIDETTRNR